MANEHNTQDRVLQWAGIFLGVILTVLATLVLNNQKAIVAEVGDLGKSVDNLSINQQGLSSDVKHLEKAVDNLKKKLGNGVLPITNQKIMNIDRRLEKVEDAIMDQRFKKSGP